MMIQWLFSNQFVINCYILTYNCFYPIADDMNLILVLFMKLNIYQLQPILTEGWRWTQCFLAESYSICLYDLKIYTTVDGTRIRLNDHLADKFKLLFIYFHPCVCHSWLCQPQWQWYTEDWICTYHVCVPTNIAVYVSRNKIVF